MSIYDLKFSELRAANLKRIPLFKNGKGEIAHPPLRLGPDFLGLHRESPECSTSGCRPVMPGADWSLGEWICAVTGELGELANLIKKVRRGDKTLSDVRDEVARELADVACYLDILALQCGVDLGDAVVTKFNEVSDRIGVDVKLGALTKATNDITERLRQTLTNARSQIELLGGVSDEVNRAHLDEIDGTLAILGGPK